MPVGTITLTNNSAVVAGAGTAFDKELKAGDMIVSVVGGVTYTLPVKSVDSATKATLIKAYDGPTQAGAAWSAVPRETLNAITAQL
ncbi:tail fiber domain-containing protein, partial [Serratia odorifera]